MATIAIARRAPARRPIGSEHRGIRRKANDLRVHAKLASSVQPVRINNAEQCSTSPEVAKAHARDLSNDALAKHLVNSGLGPTLRKLSELLPYHSYFSHSHHDYDQEAGRKDLAEEVNRLFERNGIAFQLHDGQVERLVPSVLQEILVPTGFNTGDQALNELLSTAREKFLDRDLKVRREALEKLWDAWERLKSLSDPADKRNSVKILLDRVTAEPNLRERVETEARQLTDIGNNFFIRHTEVSKPPIADSHQVDYLFHRLFSFIRMILQANGVPV